MRRASSHYSTHDDSPDTEEQKYEFQSLKGSEIETLRASFCLPARDNLFGFSVTKPVSLVVLNLTDNSFHLSQAAREYLSALQGECYVISVSGSPLVGKSSLLNLLLSLFTYYNNDIFTAGGGMIPYKDIYTVGDGKKSTTEGIDMYCISANGKNYLFLDVEGDNDPARKETGIWIYTNLITTALSVSHTHIYNYNGLPQENFFNYFESISKLVKQNKLHAQFETQFTFLKRNHVVELEEDLLQDLEEYKEYFEEKLSHEGFNYSVYMLSNPPLHITNRREKDSCVANTGFICSACQCDLFMSILIGIFQDLNDSLKARDPFRSGMEIAETLETVLTINKKELPYFVDKGHIAKIRIDRFRKDQLRISGGMAEVEQYQSEKNLSRQVQKIFNDHPNLTDVEMFQNFDKTLLNVVTKISQMEYLIPELSKFVEECLIDDKYSIIDPAEKEMIMETYLIPFDQLTKEILEALKEYDKINDLITERLVIAKAQIIANLKEFKSASNDAKAKTAVVATNMVASSVLGFVAREVAVKVLAGCLIGAGAIAAGLTAYGFYHAKKKWDKKKKGEKTVDVKKIVGINSNEEAEAEMKRIEEFVDGLVNSLEESNRCLKEVCKEEKSRNYNLIQKIEEVVDKKLEGKEVDIDDKVRLIQYMKVAQNNLERFKQST